MAPALPSRRLPPIGFALGGAAGHEPAHTTEAFALALRLGATGLHSHVWLTADGHAVLHGEGSVGGRLRRRSIDRIDAVELPADVVRLSDLLATLGDDVELSLTVGHELAALEVIALAREVGAEDRLWLTHEDVRVVASWRELSATVHLVETSRLKAMRDGPERRVADLAAMGIDALCLPQPDWSGGNVALVHRFELDALATDARFERTLDDVLRTGIDGVYCERVDLMVAAIAALGA